MTGLDDALQKLERGKEHLANFTRIIMETFDKKGFRVDIESYPYLKPSGTKDPRPWTVYTIRYSFVPSVSKSDGILMGEAIQNFRSALDYLIWAMYIKSGIRVTKHMERNIAFPLITTSSADYWKRVNAFLPNIPSNERTFIERYQPYQLTDAGMVMGWLGALSNTDKHRIIIQTPVFPREGDIKVVYGNWAQLITTLERIEPSHEVKEGTKIVSLVIAGTPPINRRPVDVQRDTLQLMIMFPIDLIRARPPYEGVAMYSALNGIRDVCTEVLAEAKEYF
jgi:hypothetical protein